MGPNILFSLLKPPTTFFEVQLLFRVQLHLIRTQNWLVCCRIEVISGPNNFSVLALIISVCLQLFPWISQGKKKSQLSPLFLSGSFSELQLSSIKASHRWEPNLASSKPSNLLLFHFSSFMEAKLNQRLRIPLLKTRVLRATLNPTFSHWYFPCYLTSLLSVFKSERD